MGHTAPGRRERKKAATREALESAARRLFLERGFDKVTVAEIADAADTAVSTLFAHFPGGKEALILGQGDGREQDVVDAVRHRPEGVSILRAMRRYFATRPPFDPDIDVETRQIVALAIATPALRAYARKIWVSCEGALTRVIAEETGRDPADFALRLLARYILDIPDVAVTEPDPAAALDTAFAHLERAWPGL